MHILIPVYFNAPLGGLHFNVMSTALHCKNNGHDVTVVCKSGIFSEKLREQNINVINTSFNDGEYYHTVNKILELNKKTKIDVIHSHPFQSRKLAVLLSEILGVPFFVTIHGRHTDQIDTYIDKVSMVFTVSEGVRDFVKGYLAKKGLSNFNHKLFVVPNGVKTELFKPASKGKDITVDNDSEKYINFSLVTRLDVDKEFIINLFYKALKFTNSKYPHLVKWTIVGDGKLKQTMIEKVKEITGENFNVVNFVGWKENDDLLAEYWNSDVVIAPGRCALEAMSCCKPVIAVGSKGYVGLIDEENWLKGVYANFGGIGKKIEDYIEGSIESDIERIVKNDSLRVKLGELGYNIIQQFYNEKTSNNNLLKFYEIFKNDNINDNKIDAVELNEVITTYLLEKNIKRVVVEKQSNLEYKIEVQCSETNNLKFAWYIFKDKQLIKKTLYSYENYLIYNFKENGTYRIKCYVKNGQTKISFYTKVINIT